MNVVNVGKLSTRSHPSQHIREHTQGSNPMNIMKPFTRILTLLNIIEETLVNILKAQKPSPSWTHSIAETTQVGVRTPNKDEKSFA